MRGESRIPFRPMERKRKKKKRKEKGKKGFEKRARQPLTRFIYLYVLHTIPRGGEVWLSHAFKFVCRNGSEAAVNAERYTIRR